MSIRIVIIRVIIVLIQLNLQKYVECDNVGWLDYLDESLEEFQNLPLEWEPGSKVPIWITGTYVRNGPARHHFTQHKRKSMNLLDGWAKLHSLKFNQGNILFSGKFVESLNYVESVDQGYHTPQMTLNKFINPDDEWNFLEYIKILTKFMDGSVFDNYNAQTWRYGPPSVSDGIYLAITDGPGAIQFNISDLSTIGHLLPFPYPITTMSSAHPLREPGTDNSINFVTRMYIPGIPRIEVHRYHPEDSFDNPQVITSFQIPEMSMVHSFSITQDYVILLLYPLTLSIMDMALNNFHVAESMTWNEEGCTDIYIVKLEDGSVQKLQTDAFYALHHVNAYQNKQNEIFVDLIPHKHDTLRDYYVFDNIVNPLKTSPSQPNEENRLTRIKINLELETVTRTAFQNMDKDSEFMNEFEMPIINEVYRGREYCFIYAISFIDYSRTSLVKKNVCDSTKDIFVYRENHYFSEPWFFQTPGSTQEDDGLLMMIVFDGEQKRSYLWFLNATNLDPVAKSFLPKRIPLSVHGMFFPEAS